MAKVTIDLDYADVMKLLESKEDKSLDSDTQVRVIKAIESSVASSWTEDKLKPFIGQVIRQELESIIKEAVSVYLETNPYHSNARISYGGREAIKSAIKHEFEQLTMKAMSESKKIALHSVDSGFVKIQDEVNHRMYSLETELKTLVNKAAAGMKERADEEFRKIITERVKTLADGLFSGVESPFDVAKPATRRITISENEG